MSRVTWLAVGLAVALVILWTRITPVSIIHYELKVVLDVGGKSLEGLSVIEASFSARPNILPDRGNMTAQFRGEAVSIAIPGYGRLYAPLTGAQGEQRTMEWLVPRVFGKLDQANKGGVDAASFVRSLQNLSGSREVPPQYMPLFVRFADDTKPETIQRVDPLRLAEFYGPKVRLRSVDITITNAPITTGIQKYLPWLVLTKGEVPYIRAPTNGMRELQGIAFSTELFRDR
jgi:hypothetical protein